jgi:hypothetical protein
MQHPVRGFKQTGSLRSLAVLRHSTARSLRAPMLAADWALQSRLMPRLTSNYARCLITP